MILRDFISLIFPDLCLGCNIDLKSGEQYFCLDCRINFPKTNFHLESHNVLINRFAGKVKVERAYAYMHFRKGSIVQHILYNIKYKGKKEAASLLGEYYGIDLSKTEMPIDIIIPVPLHKTREHRRGFNQSEWFAKGLSKSLKIDCCTTVLKRVKAKESQTKKNRIQRWENIKDVYQIRDKIMIEGKRILLVDDVITTGATCEVCAQLLLDNGALKVEIAAIACAI
jgi:ComF family protein